MYKAILRTPLSLLLLSNKHSRLFVLLFFFHCGDIYNFSFDILKLPAAKVAYHSLKPKAISLENMPSKSKAPEIAAEAKKVYIPYIKQNYPQWETTSYLIADSALQMRCSPAQPPLRCRIGT
jgi:hypothetical protein